MTAKALFFDFDGTLFDTQSDILTAYLKTFAMQGIPVDPAAFRIGPPLHECIRQVKPDISPELLNETAVLFGRVYDECGFPQTCAYPGVTAMLQKLKEKRIACYIATNKRMAPLTAILRQKNAGGFFAGFYSSDMLMPERKLSKKEMLLLALERESLNGGECFMIGDTEGDITAGRAAGMKTVAVTWGYAAPGELEKSCPDITVAEPGVIAELAGC